MCEFLLRVVDKVNPDPALNIQCTKRGDIIVAVPDGWAWSAEERTNPEWRIVKVTGMPLNEGEQYTLPETGAEGDVYLMKRLSFCDIAAMPLVVRNALLQEPRPEFYTITAAALRPFLKRKPARARVEGLLVTDATSIDVLVG